MSSNNISSNKQQVVLFFGHNGIVKDECADIFGNKKITETNITSGRT